MSMYLNYPEACRPYLFPAASVTYSGCCCCCPEEPVQPTPAFGNFASTSAQFLTPSVNYTPVTLSAISSSGVTLEDDNYTVTVQRSGLYQISYSVTPASGANANASAAVLLPGNGNPPPTLPLSVRPLTVNGSAATATFLANLTAGERLFLGIRSTENVILNASPSGAPNATLTLLQVG